MRHNKLMPTGVVILLDLLGIGALLGILAVNLFLLPFDMSAAQDLSASAATTLQPVITPAVTEEQATLSAAPEITPTPSPSPTPGPGNFSLTFPADEPVPEDAYASYVSDDLRIIIDRVDTGKAVYFVADVWIRTIDEFKTAFATGEYGRYKLEMPSKTAADNNAILAISGDSYGSRKYGLVIRDGFLYRDSMNSDVCVLYSDGVLESYYQADFDLEAAIAREPLQGWSFGPKLLNDGAITKNYNTTSTIISHNPRAAIGYYEPGHYCLIVVDGRQSDYSIGMTLDELSQVFLDLGCVDAYNLDGGQSAMMVFQGEVLGQPYKGGREISDIIYFGGDSEA